MNVENMGLLLYFPRKKTQQQQQQSQQQYLTDKRNYVLLYVVCWFGCCCLLCFGWKISFYLKKRSLLFGSHEATKFKRIHIFLPKQHKLYDFFLMIKSYFKYSWLNNKQNKTSSAELREKGGVWWWYTRHLYIITIFLLYYVAIVCFCSTQKKTY